MPTRKLKVYSVPAKKGYDPQIRLQGKWLRNAGLEVGDKLKVQVEQGKIVIERTA